MKKEKSLIWGYILAFLLGGIGTHLFYYRKYIRGLLYLIFCWTYIPVFLGWIDMFFVKKWTNEVNGEIRKRNIDSNQNIEVDNSFKQMVDEKTVTRLDKENEVKTKEEEKPRTEKIATFLKDAFTFYNEEEIIISKYSHLKTPKHLVSHLSLSNYHSDFTKDSLRYAQKREIETKEIPFQAYWPTFKSLDKRQLKWYFYWREQALKGNYIEVDLSYIFIFIYELLNYSFNKNAAFNISMLVRLLDNYKDMYPKLETYLISWIADMLYELGEEELAEQWGGSEEENLPKIYKVLLENSNELQTISMSVWKPYIRNYRETKFFQKYKSKIYKKFKESIPLLQEAYRENGSDLLSEWFEVREARNIRYLFHSAVVDRIDREIHVRGKECRLTGKLFEELPNLFRLAENVIRIEEGEKRQIKVDEEVLPKNMKEKMLEINKRFKTVQTKKSIKGSSIPTPPVDVIKDEGIEKKTQQEQPSNELKFDWDEINKKEEELVHLRNKIEAIEYDKVETKRIEITPTKIEVESEEDPFLVKINNESKKETRLLKDVRKDEEKEKTTQQEQLSNELKFDWDEVNKKEEDLDHLRNKIEAIEYDEEETKNIEIIPTTLEFENVEESSLDKKFNALEKENKLDLMFANENEDFEGLLKALTESEKEFLLLFEDNYLSIEDAKKFTRKIGSMVGLFVTELNEKSDEFLRDILLVENADTIEIIEDFVEIVSLIKGVEIEN